MRDYKNVRSMMKAELNTLYTDLPEPAHVSDMNTRTNCILDADNQKAYIDEYLKEYQKLKPEERESLRKLLKNMRTFLMEV